jgi:hypothetical protein
MTENSASVLLAGIGRGPFNALAPVLNRRHVEIERTAALEDAVNLAFEKKFDLIIFDTEPDERTLGQIVAGLRGLGSASHDSSVLVVAAPDAVKASRKLVGRGVNRVVSVDTAEEIIEQHVADLLDIAPRAAVRFSTRLSTIVDNGEIEALGQTANVSLTGMLIQTTTVLEPGQLVMFEILTGDGNGKVSGEAEIVRHAVADRGGVDGIGVRILGFTGDGRQRLETILAEYLLRS